jgi:drug/metabolite transporter (DMT)-like permease
MIYLVLTILGSLLTSVVLKVNETRGGNRFVVAGMNYTVAALLALAMGGLDHLGIGGGWIALGLLTGAGFIGGFLLLMQGIGMIGLAIPTSDARLSMLIPVSGSILLFGEYPSGPQIVGVGAGIAAFIMLGAAQRRRGSGEKLDLTAIGILVALFTIVGCTDFSMKAAQAQGIHKDAYAFWIFLSAAACCWIAVVVRRPRLLGSDLMLGIVLGIPNYFSVYFLLLALRDLHASVVFPTVSAGGVIAVTATAVIFWREHPNRTAWIGIALAAVAVALLGLPG